MTLKCPKCSESAFRVKPLAPSGSAVTLAFVCCAGCGTVVGAMPNERPGAAALDKRLKRLERTVESVRDDITTLARLIGTRGALTGR